MNRIDALKGQKIIGWKKAIRRTKGGRKYYVLIKLEIGARTRRVQPCNRKCRAATARVLEITTLKSKIWEAVVEKGGRKLKYAFANYHYYSDPFRHDIGAIVKPRKKYDPCTFDECRSGIHFFLTEQEARDYSL